MLVSASWRLARALLLLVAASTVVFVACVALPGDAVEFRTRGGASDEVLTAMRQQAGLDQRLVVQYVHWAAALVRGNPGTSLVSDRPVATLIAERFDVSVALAVLAMGVAVPAMLALAWLAADGPARLRGAAAAVAVGGAAVPLVAVVVLLAVLATWASGGVAGPVVFLASGVPVWQQLGLLVLPAVALSLPTACYGAGVLRGPWADAAVHPSVSDARIRGLPGWLVTGRYVLPRIAPVALRTTALLAGGVLGGAAVVETMFGISGLGSLLVSAVGSRDLPVVMAVAMLAAAVVIGGFTLADMAAGAWRR